MLSLTLVPDIRLKHQRNNQDRGICKTQILIWRPWK
ncbi:DUF3700 domain-containing protein [Psidium guajava]|nr:DUF3700 domain-containing protein [Psidium guajava]